MRVVILSCYNGRVNRGVESWAINLCQHLQRLGHTCLIVQGGETLPPGAIFRTVSIKSPPRRATQRALPKRLQYLINRCYFGPVDREVAHFTWRALPTLLAFRPHVIIPASNFWTVVAAKVAGWILDGQPRIVVTSQAGWSQYERDNLRVGVDGFVAIQPRVYDWAMVYERARTVVDLTPNGVDVERFAHGPRATAPLEPPTAIVVSALEGYKQVEMAVRAAARAGMSLLVLGDGPEAITVDQVANQLLGPRRYLRIRSVGHDDVGMYYRAADVFTLPSTAGEAFGIAIIEALAAGLPVVVNDDPVRRWIAGPHGYFVDARDTVSYADALQQALDTAGDFPAERAQHLATFDWPAVAERYGIFFTRVRARPRPWPYSRLLALPRLATQLLERALDFTIRR